MSNTALDQCFAQTAAESRAALIGYLPAGYPDLPGSIRAMQTLAENGFDAIEIGVPYSDPLMDGPLIAGAATHALAQGFRVPQLFEIVREVAQTSAVATCMTYWNIVERYGLADFAMDFAQAGGAGVITPDIIPDEAAEWIDATDAAQVSRIFLVAPSSTLERMAAVARVSNGFVYAASTMGVTGTRTELSSSAAELVQRQRQVQPARPIAVGIGVSTATQAAEVAGYADGVIVGSALVKALTPTIGAAPDFVRLADIAQQLSAGVRRNS